MPAPADILARYLELQGHCDTLERRVGERFGRQWQCRAGCGGCCRLTTVCGLEALVLLRAGIGSLPAEPPAGAPTSCCLLDEGRCRLYEARPLICRSHGLPLVSVQLTDGEVDCCPLNLPALAGLDELEAELVLDLDRLTEDLLRLNLALFLLLGRPELAETRFPLRDLLTGDNLPPELLDAAATP